MKSTIHIWTLAKLVASLAVMIFAAFLLRANPVSAADALGAVFGNGGFARSNSSSGTVFEGALGAESRREGFAQARGSLGHDLTSAGSAIALGGPQGAATRTVTDARGSASFDGRSDAWGGDGSFANTRADYQSMNGSDANASAFGGFGLTFDRR